jgi:predicted Kef-type K+ transport protein
MKDLALIFTPDRRQAIQLFAGALAPLAILLGYGTAGGWEQSLIILGAALQFVSSVLSLVNLRKGDIGAGWAILRGAIYTLAATASPALVLLGFYDEQTNATVLLAISLGLAALSNLLAIFIGKQEQITALAFQLEQGDDGTWAAPLDPHNPANFQSPGAHND